MKDIPVLTTTAPFNLQPDVGSQPLLGELPLALSEVAIGENRAPVSTKAARFAYHESFIGMEEVD